MMFQFLVGINGLATECTQLQDGIVLSKYYLESCAACKRLSPVLEEIMDRASRAQISISLREVECTDCECEGITNFPTLEITEDKLPKARSIGYKDYKDLAKWIKDALTLDPQVFANHIEHDEGIVKELVSRDFLSGFGGQWLVLFYKDLKDTRREIFKELAKRFKDKISVAEASDKESENVTARYNITEYPFIMAINHGTSVPYTGVVDLPSLSEFADKLHRAAFENITYSELKEKTRQFRNGEPVYVVLYKNFELASFYFNELAQQFKFKATIYRSNDPAMFSAAGHHPKDIGDFEEDPDHNKMVYLTVFKNSSFFTSPAPLDDSHGVIEWIFHTHFPHVTNINNDNFYTVFHGIKPVMLLLTRSEMLLEEFNRLSASWHLGAPSSNLIFATLDSAEYPLFKEHVLKDVKEPAILFYDPVTSTWYHRNARLTKENFSKAATDMIDSYFTKKLAKYPPQKSRYNMYAFGALGIAVLAFIYKAMSVHSKVD